MSKAGSNQALSNEESTLASIQAAVKGLENEWNQGGAGALSQMYPELLSTIQGGSSPLMTAATAPVYTATSQAEGAAQQEASGLTNPDALYSNIAYSGQQAAGNAADSTISSALSSLGSLISGQESSLTSGLSDLGGVASDYGNISQQLNPWSTISSILSAAAEAYGATKGASKASTPSTPSNNNTNVAGAIQNSTASAGTNAGGINTNSLASLLGIQPTASAPTSQLGQSTSQNQQPQQSPFTFFGAG